MENNSKYKEIFQGNSSQRVVEFSSQRPLLLFSIGHGLTHWYAATFIILIPIIGVELGLSYLQIGFIMTFKSITAMLFNILGGIIADMVSKRSYLLTLALFWVGIPYLLMGFASSYWIILLCISLVDIGNALWHPSAMPILSQIYSGRKGLALSVHSMGANIGEAFAPLVIGTLLVTISWREVVVINFLPGFIMAILFYLLIENTKVIPTVYSKNKSLSFSDYITDVKCLMTNKSLILLCTTAGFRSMAQVTLKTFLPLYLAYELELSIFLVGIALFIFQATGFAASPLAGYYSDVKGRRKVLMFCMVISFIVLLSMAFLGKSILFIVLVAILGFFLFALRPVLQAWLIESVPEKMGGSGVSVMFSSQSLFSIIGPVLAGIVAEIFGLFAVFYFVAGTIMIANTLVFFMPDDSNKNHSSSESI